ncbi:MAG: winged helix DNA-binding domain-containing protein, partial [Thermoplasmata archaeon]
YELLASGDVIKGRFQGGRVCFIRRRDVGPVISLYRQLDLNPMEEKVLDYIKSRVANQRAGADTTPSTDESNLPNLGTSGESGKPLKTNYEEFCSSNNNALKNEGVTRSELISAFKYKESDIIDTIDKLDYNLYIARSKRDTRQYGILNRYIPLELESDHEDAAEMLVKQFISGYGPVNFMSIRNALRLPNDFLKDLLQLMTDKGTIFKFVVVGEGPMEVYADPELRTALLRFNTASARTAASPKRKRKREVRLLSQTDPFARRFEFSIKNKFGEDWHVAIFDGYQPRGVINLWKLASSIEIRNIELDPDLNKSERERLLEAALKELDKLMELYNSNGLDILRIKAFSNTPVEELQPKLKSILKDNGYNLIQGIYVKGRVLPATFTNQEIMNFVLYRQHIHPQRRFDDPMDIIRAFGGIRSTFELHLRLNGRSYDLKEYGRHHALATGQMIPEFLMYCTEVDAQLYRTAKGYEQDEIMEHVLSRIPDDTPVKSKDLQDRVNLSEPTYKKALKRLYEGLYVIKTPLNYYKKISSMPELSFTEARKMVVKRVFENFGIFTAEGLAAFLKRGFTAEELRVMLRELEDEGVLAKGYLVEGESELYWILKGAAKKIRKLPRLKERFILSPQDQLCHYLIESIREKFKIGSCFVVFNGSEMTGAFKATRRSNRFIVDDFIGDDEDWGAVRQFAHQHRLELAEKEQDELYDYD